MRPRTLHRGATKSVLGALVVATALAACAYAFGMPFPGSSDRSGSDPQRGVQARRPPPALTIRTPGAQRTVAPGRAAHVRVSIRRGQSLIRPRGRGQRRLAAPIWLRVDRRRSPGISAAFRPRATRSTSAVLAIKVRDRTPPGTYHLRLHARGRLHLKPGYRMHHAHTTITFVVRAASAAPRTLRFGVEGTAQGLLAPGASQPVDLTLENPHSSALIISRLAVGIAAIHAPDETASRPCTAADFEVAQFSGAYGFAVPASSRRSLSELGIPRAQWPRITMSNRPVNQDG